MRKLTNDDEVILAANYVASYLYQLSSPEDKDLIDTVDSLEFTEEVQSRLKGVKTNG